MPGESTPLSSDKQMVVAHFKDTHKVLPVGRFCVQLPRRSPALELCESHSTALRRYRLNEMSHQRKKLLSQFHKVLHQ